MLRSYSSYTGLNFRSRAFEGWIITIEDECKIKLREIAQAGVGAFNPMHCQVAFDAQGPSFRATPGSSLESGQALSSAIRSCIPGRTAPSTILNPGLSGTRILITHSTSVRLRHKPEVTSFA